MFGTRDGFEYLECGACGTLQITEIPDLRKYYPATYYSLEQTEDFQVALTLKQRIEARLIARHMMGPNTMLGGYITRKKQWMADHFPASLRGKTPGLNFRSHILDFGCGNGYLLNTLRQFGFRNLTGADAFIDSDIIYPNDVKIYRRSLSELEPLFDLIMLHHSFEHLPDPLESLMEIKRLLADSGTCLIRIPLVNYAWEKYGVNWVQLDPPRHLFLYTERSFRNLADMAGFTVEKVIYDSEAFQFWGSEQYVRDISLNDERAYKGAISESIFTEEQLDEWQRKAEELNRQSKGDQACFYLRKK